MSDQEFGKCFVLYEDVVGQCGKNINDCSEKYDQLSLKPAYYEVKKDMEDHVPIIGTPQVFGQTFRTKSNNCKRKKTTDMTINDLVNNKTQFPTVVSPMGKMRVWDMLFVW